MDAVELAGRSGDDFAGRLVSQHQRPALDERREERPPRVGGRHAAGQPRWKVTQLPEQPGNLHVGERDFMQRAEDGLG
jgi:hypothetical protein